MCVGGWVTRVWMVGDTRVWVVGCMVKKCLWVGRWMGDVWMTG